MKMPDWLRALRSWNLLLATVAIAAGFAASATFDRVLEARRTELERTAAERDRRRDTVVVARDVAAGERLAAADLAVRAVPVAFVAPDAARPDEAGQLVGRMTAIPLRRGDPVAPRTLRAPRASRPAERLEPGERAVTIVVDERNAMAGLVQPGDRIDLLYSPPDGGTGARVLPLLQAVAVLATGSDTDPADLAGGDAGEPAATLTLRVAAEDAARVALAQRAGRLTVVLRPRDDTNHLAPVVRSSAQLLPARGAGPLVHGVEYIVGGSGGGLVGRMRQPSTRLSTGGAP